jgi:hypothetical protein
MIRRRLLAIGLAAGALSSAGGASTAHAPTLKAAGSPLVVYGRAFAPGERVRVTLAGVKGFAPRELRANARGRFRVVVAVLLRCGSLAVVRARGEHGRVATLVLPAPPCVPPPRE